MPNWKKLIVSGSDASLNSLNVTNNVTAQSFTGSFSGSFTAPGATTQVVYNNGGVLAANSGFVYSGSNVGIGVASPGVRLDVSGDIRASNVLYGSSTFVNLIRMNGGTELPFRNSSNVEVMRITSAGNLGIGTTSPAFKLDVNSGTTASAFRVLSANTSSLRTFLEATSGNVEQHFLYTGNQDWVLGLDKADSNKFKLASADDGFASAKLTVTTGGNVGIGITTPLALLHIAKNATYNNVANTALRVANVTSPNKAIDFGYDNTADVGYIQGIEYGVAAKNLSLQSDGGNVGIGTTSPGFKLEVSGSAKVTYLQIQNNGYAGGLPTTPEIYSPASATLAISAGGAERLRIDTGSIKVSSGVISLDSVLGYLGNSVRYESSQIRIYQSGNVQAVFGGDKVGIGTTSPSEKLSLAGSTATTFGLSLEPSGWNSAKHRLTVPTSGDVSMWSFNWNGSAVDSALYAPASILLAQGTITFNTTGSANNPAARMIINTVGNVGIGTSSPSYRLDVSGSFRVDGTNGDFIVDSTGNDIYLTRNGASYFIANQASSTISFLMGAGVSQSLFLANNGSVAIGATSTSGYKLYVAGDTWIGGTTNYIDGTTILRTAGASEVMRIASSGNVGIGTTTPSSLLNVVAAGNNSSALVVEDNARKVKIGRDQIQVTDLSDVASTMYLQPNSNLVINSTAGNVGIGTQPSQKLDVAGAISVSGSVVDYEVAPALIGGVTTTNIISFTPGTHYAAFVDYVIKDSAGATNQRVGTIQISISLAAAAAVLNEVTTADIGNTSAITFAVSYGAPTWLTATNSGPTPYDINYMVRYF